jgi:hypothetical protein
MSTPFAPLLAYSHQYNYYNRESLMFLIRKTPAKAKTYFRTIVSRKKHHHHHNHHRYQGTLAAYNTHVTPYVESYVDPHLDSGYAKYEEHIQPHVHSGMEYGRERYHSGMNYGKEKYNDHLQPHVQKTVEKCDKKRNGRNDAN